MIGGINTLIRNYNKIPSLPDIGELGTVNFAGGLETSAERTQRYRAQTQTVSAGQFLAATGVGGYSTGDAFGRGGQVRAVTINVNGNFVGSQEEAHRIATELQRAEALGGGPR